jgi:virulence-associated protein VagC
LELRTVCPDVTVKQKVQNNIIAPTEEKWDGVVQMLNAMSAEIIQTWKCIVVIINSMKINLNTLAASAIQ